MCYIHRVIEKINTVAYQVVYIQHCDAMHVDDKNVEKKWREYPELYNGQSENTVPHLSVTNKANGLYLFPVF